ncbi:protein of unknown function [Shewanella benthica]|uniref:Uncharacterized protein n=1 Tax=Shewanella benthica TaxID=43661 RepID=A0A330M981_9GAMM|nr:protein of unknown function [Shewanella benthica]
MVTTTLNLNPKGIVTTITNVNSVLQVFAVLTDTPYCIIGVNKVMSDLWPYFY